MFSAPYARNWLELHFTNTFITKYFCQKKFWLLQSYKSRLDILSSLSATFRSISGIYKSTLGRSTSGILKSMFSKCSRSVDSIVSFRTNFRLFISRCLFDRWSICKRENYWKLFCHVQEWKTWEKLFVKALIKFVNYLTFNSHCRLSNRC